MHWGPDDGGPVAGGRCLHRNGDNPCLRSCNPDSHPPENSPYTFVMHARNRVWSTSSIDDQSVVILPPS